MLIKFTIFIVILNYVHGNELDSRTDRAFSLFNVVKFKNTGCQSVTDPNLQGVCYTSQQCSDKGGLSDGNCAAAFGVCCILKLQTCGSMITQNCSYVENVGYPTAVTTAGACAYTIQKCSTDICQVRLDFKDFRLAQPNANGMCATDNMVVGPVPNGNNNKAPLLCGDQRGQHVYVDVGRTTTTNAMSLTFATTVAGTGQWRIKVSQIECSSADRAPDGCLQYFREPMSIVQSFNFGNGAGDCATGCHLSNQDYNVCFRKNEGMCAIDYTPTMRTTGDSFQLGANAAADVGVKADINAAGCLDAANAGNNNNAAINILNVSLNDGSRTIAAAISLHRDTFCGNFLSGTQGDIKSAVIRQNQNHLFGFRVIALNLNIAMQAGFELSASQVPC